MVSVIDVQKAYLAYFGRPADTAGLDYWMNSDAATMRAGFAASAEYAALYSGMTAEQRVEQVYQNLLGRASDAAGKAYWVNEFNAGRETVSSLVTSMQTNALGVDISTIDNRVTYAILFTAQLDTPAEVVGYSGTAAADAARGAVSAVTYTDASLATARSTIVADTASVVAGVDPTTAPTTTPDTTPPSMSSAAVSTNGLNIVVTYSEALTGTAEAGDYGVTLSSNSTTVTGATIGSGADANKVTLTVSNTIAQGVTVSNLVYTATAGTASSIRDTAANNAATQTLATVTNSSTATGLTFTLTTATDTFTGGTGNDTFNGTYGNGAGPYTLQAADVLNGGAGTLDTLNITTGAEASTPGDGLWANKTNFEKIVFNSTGAGAQVVTTGANFNAAFTTGADLNVQTFEGAIDVTMTGYAPTSTITTTTIGAGAHTIVTGTGTATVNAASQAAGSQTINGVGLTTVTATIAGAGDQVIGTTNGGNIVSVNATISGVGNQTITSTSASNVTVIASAFSGAQTITTAGGADSITLTTAAGQLTTISTGAGNDTIVGSLGTDTITGGLGADTMTGGGGVVVDTFSFVKADSNATTLDTITDYRGTGLGADVINLTDVVTAAGTTATIQDLTGQANLAAALGAAANTNIVDLGLSMFVWGGDTYAFVETTGATTTYVASDFVVKLTGTTGHAIGANIAGLGFDGI